MQDFFLNGSVMTPILKDSRIRTMLIIIISKFSLAMAQSFDNPMILLIEYIKIRFI